MLRIELIKKKVFWKDAGVEIPAFYGIHTTENCDGCYKDCKVGDQVYFQSEFLLMLKSRVKSILKMRTKKLVLNDYSVLCGQCFLTGLGDRTQIYHRGVIL